MMDLDERSRLSMENLKFGPLSFSKHDRITKGSKHIELKYLILKQDVSFKKIVVFSIRIGEQVADLFTEGLHIHVFQKHTESMGLTDSS